VEGDRILVYSGGYSQERKQYNLLDAATGSRLFTVTVEDPPLQCGRTGYGLSESGFVSPFLIIATSRGVHVYRRDDADRDD
jgi:hypothetical protein